MLKLKDWVNKGGILIRFSDKNMIESRDIFLDGNKSFIYIRNMGKDLSIQKKYQYKTLIQTPCLAL